MTTCYNKNVLPSTTTSGCWRINHWNKDSWQQFKKLSQTLKSVVSFSSMDTVTIVEKNDILFLYNP